MFIVILIAAVAIWGGVATIVELRRDGHRAIPTDWARLPGDPAGRGQRRRTRS
ncbi:hypothetical protein J2Y69_001634 [Microbacterium resistens]|uniref:Methionine/alanine import family NSS transporter small subunit n=1 Tax=Microbacterium resistens TaxID=156977 RepID=A0ABU1SBP7_9MICO|nr:hypothetical protein [Microbacterium resistens]MDR6867035.1 hypothetical protein [Microbacterium resistens]